MKIHAFRRKEAIAVDLFGERVEFSPNDKGDVVAAVETPEVIDRLLSIKEAYRRYGEDIATAPAPAPVPSGASADEGSSEDGTDGEPGGEGEAGAITKTESKPGLDLSSMSAKQLRAYAEQVGVKLPGSNGTPVAELRKILTDALNGGNA